MRAIRTVFLVALLVVVAAFAAAVRFGETFAEKQIRSGVISALPGKTSIGEIRIALFPPVVVLRHLEIRNFRAESVMTVERVEARLAVWPSLWEGAWITDLEIERPRVRYRDDDDFWVALRSRNGTDDGGTVLPRKLAVHSGEVHVRAEKAALDAVVEAISFRSELSGLVIPRIAVDLVARAKVSRAGRETAVRRFHAGGFYESGEFHLEEMRLESDGVRLMATGLIGSNDLDAEIDADIDLDHIAPLVPEAGIVAGSGTISARLRGPFLRPDVDARLDARTLRIDDVVLSGRGTLRTEGNRWRLTAPRVEMFGGTVEGEATGTLHPDLPYSVTGRFREWDPARFVSLFGVEVPLRGAWSGEATLEGRLLADEVRGRGRFALRQDDAELSGEARFRDAPGSAEVEGVVQTRTGDRIECTYGVERDAIRGEVRLRADEVETFAPFIDLDVSGAGTLEGAFSGTSDHPVLSGRIDGRNVRFRTLPLGVVTGAYEISTDGLRTDDLSALEGRARVRGTIALSPSQTNDWKLELESVPVEDAVALTKTFRADAPDVSGSGTGNVEAHGRWSEPAIDARLRISSFAIGGETLGDLDLEVSRAEGWTAAGEIRGDVTATFSLREVSGKLSGEIHSAKGRLEQVRWIHDRWPDVRGDVQLSGRIDGTVDDPLGEAEILFSGVHFEEEALGDATATVRIAEERIDLTARSADRWGIQGHMRIAAPHAFEADARWDDIDVAPLLIPRADLEIRATGSARLKGDVRDPLDEGELDVARLTISRERFRMTNRDPLRVRLRKGTAELPKFVLANETQQLSITGRLEPEGIEVAVDGTGDLGLLEAFAPQVASARGPVEIQLRAHRRAGSGWEAFGKGNVRDGVLDLGFLVGITALAGEIVFDGHRAEIRDLAGTVGGGGFLLAGSVGTEGWALGWAIRDASLGVPEWLDYRASGSGRMTGPLRRPTLDGEIEITQALYDRRVEWGEFLPWFRREAQASRRSASLPIELDLRLFAEGGLFVDNNLVEAELGGSLGFRGAGESVTWSGRVDVLTGEFIFRRRRFTVTAGSVTFTASRPLNPDLEFRGETTITTGEADYEIFLHVSGTAKDPRVEFAADDPALTENDVLALVTFGRTVAQLQAQGAGIELTEVLSLTAGPRAGDVEERIYGLLPVDRIEIQPTFSRTTGTTEPRLSVGKDLAEGLRAVLGSGLGAERQQDVSLEYQLTPRISVQGVWESQTESDAGAFGGDLKFRYVFRTFRQFSLLPMTARENP